MTHPLVTTLSQSTGVDMIDVDTIDAYLAGGTDCLTLVFFAGHNANKLETPDVAVVLIELLKIFGNSVRVAIVDADSERDLMAQCAVLMLPSISVFHQDKHLKTIAKIQDWDVYIAELPALLAQAGLAQN